MEIEYRIKTDKGDIVWKNGEVKTTRGLMLMLEVINAQNLDEISAPSGMVCDGINHLEHEFCFKAIIEKGFKEYTVTKNVTDADGTVLVDPKRGINLLGNGGKEKEKNTKKGKKLEAHLREILGGKVVPFSYKKVFPWLFEIRRAYKALGGIMDDFPANVGDWDVFLDQSTAEKKLGFEREAMIELDEEQHFNRYRRETLNAPFYSELTAFPLNDYRHYCRSHENAALRKGSHGGFWTNKSAEKQFGPAGKIGILDDPGAPRWKQRAFYDMVKDLASLVFNIPLARISVWDHVHLEDGTTEDVRSILKLDPDRVSPQQVEALRKLVLSRLSASSSPLSDKKEEYELEKCPYCAEWIKTEAIKCKHCGEMLNGVARVKKVNAKDGAEMVFIPAGEFLMGSQSEHRPNQHPQHKVYLDAYYIYKYEVTNEQFAQFVSETGYDAEGDWKMYAGAGKEKHPVMNVTWNDALAYCCWAGGSLPTEAQWEKAARGSDRRVYPWGDNWDGLKCNWYKGPKVPGMARNYEKRGTTPVDSFPSGASPYGVQDMAGNVWEWCSDWYDENYYKSSPSRNPEGPASGGGRVIRGGSWTDDNSRFFRCAIRHWFVPDYFENYLGFRVCCSSNTH